VFVRRDVMIHDVIMRLTTYDIKASVVLLTPICYQKSHILYAASVISNRAS